MPARTLLLQVGHELAVLLPISVAYLERLETLLGYLQFYRSRSASFAEMLESPDRLPIRGLLQKIINLHERLDLPGRHGCDLSQVNELRLAEVFGEGGEIYALNTIPPTPPRAGGEAQVAAPPPFGTGSVILDLLADLTVGLGNDFSQAQLALGYLRVDQIQPWLRRAGDLWNPEQLQAEAAQQTYQNFLKTHNPGGFDDEDDD